MSLACPNKSSKEWKTLVSQTGEDLANLAFVANGYRVPDVQKITDIKKAIGFKPNVENFAGIANKLRKFNQNNGTSHYFVAERAWGNTFNLTLKYNYLPVNVEQQRQRMAAKGDPLYTVNEFDAQGFSNMYPTSANVMRANNRTDEALNIKPGVQGLFNSNPELANIGTQQQYSQYLNTIFPDSKVKDILYHGSDRQINEFNTRHNDAGTHFGTLQAAKDRSSKHDVDYKDWIIHTVLINANSIYNQKDDLGTTGDADLFYNLYENKLISEQELIEINEYIDANIAGDSQAISLEYQSILERLKFDSVEYINRFEDKGSTSYIVFEPEQIHILGSKQDIEGFKKFVDNFNIKPGVSELFESNSELANEVYSALGIGKFRVTLGKELNPEQKFGSQGEPVVKKFEVLDEHKKVIGTVTLDIAEGGSITAHPKLTTTGKGYGQELYQIISLRFGAPIIEWGPHNISKSPEGKKLWNSLEKKGLAKAKYQWDDDLYLRGIDLSQQKQQAQQLYSQYLNTVFPESKIKDIVYHGTASPITIEKLKTQNGRIYFSNDLTAARYASWDQDNRNQFEPETPTRLQVIPAIVNLVTPVRLDSVNFKETETNKQGDGIIGTNIQDPLGGVEDQILVRSSEQVYELGTAADIRGFKTFVENLESRTDELIARAYTQVEAVEKRRENKINTEIIKQRQLLKNVKDADELNKIMSRLEKLKQQSDEAESRVIVSQRINAFEDVLLYGDKQLSEIEKMLANSAVSADDGYYAQRVLDLWRKAGDFSTRPEEHIILDEDEFNTPDIRSEFRELGYRAEDLQNRLTSINEDHVTSFVRQFTDSTLTTEDIYNHLADVHKLGTTTLNLSRHDDPMMQAAFLSVEQANIRAQQEAADIWKDLDKLGAKFLKKSGGNYNILKQVTEDGKETGRVVHRFSSEFFDTRNNLLQKAFRSKDKAGKLKKDPATIKAYFDWINKNTITFDVRALIPDSNLEAATIPKEFLYNRVTFSEAAKQEHIAELKAQLGEKGYQFYIEQAEKKIAEFKDRRQSRYEAIQSEEKLSKDEKDALFMEWLKEYSPYWGIDMQDNISTRSKGKNSFYAPKGVREYGVQVPRKTVGGVESKWYDKNFARIEADDDLLNYHNYLMETLNKMRYLLPEQKKALMGVGILPTIKKSLMDKFAEKGMMIGIAPFVDKMKQLQTTTDFATTVYSDINPLTGIIEKDIQIQYIADTNEQVRDIVKQMKIKHAQETGKPATNSEIKKFREAAKDMLSKQKSWDVTMLLKAYSLEVLSHKHKSFIEPQIKLLDQAFKKRKEIITNKAGEPQKLPSVEGAEEQIATKETGPGNLQSAWDFFFDSTYYSIGARKVEGVTKKKLYTAEEKKQKAELEALIEKETDPQSKEFLETQLNNLGGFRTGSGVGDAILKYMTLKGLGWNFFSGASNIGFGAISNIIEASGGQNYNMTDFRKATMLVTNSIGRNVSFNFYEGVNGNAIKIRTLMDKWDLNSTSTKELFDMSNKSSLSKFKRFGPFSIQERSEYLNIAPVMVAIMLSDNFSATDPDGNKVTLWDAYDINTGTLKEGFTSDIDEVKLVQKMKRVIEMNHGDYYNQLQVKQTILGRGLSQFRTWMFEGFANRFESEKVDYALSYGLDEPYIRKGRYKSYSKGQLVTTAAAVGTMFLPGVGTALGAGIGYLVGQGANLQSSGSIVTDTLYTLKQLARKLMFSSSRKTAFEDKFSKVDAANMRKNMTELYLMLTLMGVAMVLKAMADDDDEDDTVGNFLINQTVRLRTDISFYTNPMEIEKLTKTALPMAQLVMDVTEVVSDIGNFFGEDSKDKSIFQSGTFKGQPKFLIHTMEALPGTAMGIRWFRTGDKVLE